MNGPKPSGGRNAREPLGGPAVLVVDDDDSTLAYFATILTARGYQVATSASGEQALARLATQRAPAVVLLDLIMPGMNGLALLDRIKVAYPSIPVIVVSAVGQLKTIVDAIQRGATDYLTKPFREQELDLAVRNALEKQQLKDEVSVLRQRLEDDSAPAGVVSCDPGMLRIQEIARQVADTDAPVLILGESGVGKEVVATYIHAQSSRREEAFVRVNCAALPNDLLESELFGYERGAFSGALKDKPGKFELAHKGSILLDEIGEMSPNLQAKLLHVLQDGGFSRLGARQSIQVDCRVLAATNSKLAEAVAAGRFREDLYFRLNVIRIEIPPLRERREDIPVLCDYFLQKYRTRYKSTAEALPGELMEAFLGYDWPGNVRELENAVRRYLILPDIELTLLELRRASVESVETERPAPLPAAEPAAEPASPPQEGASLKQVAARAAEAAERELVGRVLEETRWNRKETARRLKVSYKALLNKLKRWDLTDAGSSGGRP